jgi:hypothetical protein
MKTKPLFVLFLCWSWSLSGLAAPVKKKAEGKAVCGKSHLAEKNCPLRGFGLKVQVTESKVNLFDGTSRQLQDFPYPGEAVEWQDVRLKKIGPRLLLEMRLWDTPVGDVPIQSLLWLGYEIKDLHLTKKWAEVLQKRTRVQSKETVAGERPKGQFKDPLPPRYIYDRLEKYKVRTGPKGLLNWSVGAAKYAEDSRVPAPDPAEVAKKAKAKAEAEAKEAADKAKADSGKKPE